MRRHPLSGCSTRGAQDRIRTCTPFRALRPERSAAAVTPLGQFGAQDRIRTCTPFRAQRPQRCVAAVTPPEHVGGSGGNRTLTPPGNTILNRARLPISPRSHLAEDTGLEPADRFSHGHQFSKLALSPIQPILRNIGAPIGSRTRNLLGDS